MIYLVGWGLIYFAIFIFAFTRYHGKELSALALLFIAVIAIFRGNVGTDTATYENMLLSFISQNGWQGTEPGFFAMGWLFIKSFDSAEIAVRVISLLFYFFLFVFFFRADKNELFFLMAYILPTFAYQYSMNGLRIGIASAILMLAVQEFRMRSYLSGSAMTLSTLLFHYSALISLVFIYITQRRWIKISNLIMLIITIALSILIFYFNTEYFSYKISAYEEMQSPSILSGLSKVFVIIVIISGTFIAKIPTDEKIKIIIPGIVSTVIFWWISSFTYAGLRILDLISFALPVSLLMTYSRIGLFFDMPVKIALFFGGLTGAATVYRVFLLEFGQGRTPFLPYEFSTLLF